MRKKCKLDDVSAVDPRIRRAGVSMSKLWLDIFGWLAQAFGALLLAALDTTGAGRSRLGFALRGARQRLQRPMELVESSWMLTR